MNRLGIEVAEAGTEFNEMQSSLELEIKTLEVNGDVTAWSCL